MNVTNCPNCGHEFVLDDDDDQELRSITWRIDPETKTIWEVIDQEWVNTHREPTAIELMIYAMRPIGTPFTRMISSHTATNRMKWGTNED